MEKFYVSHRKNAKNGRFSSGYEIPQSEISENRLEAAWGNKMNTLLAPLKELGEYDEIVKVLAKKSGKVSVSGCVDS